MNRTAAARAARPPDPTSSHRGLMPLRSSSGEGWLIRASAGVVQLRISE